MTHQTLFSKRVSLLVVSHVRQFLCSSMLPAIPFAPNPSGHHPARRPFPNTSFGSCPSGVPRKPTIRADQLACAFVRCRRGGTQSDLLQSPETNDAQATADASGSPSRPGHPVCTADQSFRRPPLNPTTLRHQQLPPSPASTPSPPASMVGRRPYGLRCLLSTSPA